MIINNIDSIKINHPNKLDTYYDGASFRLGFYDREIISSDNEKNIAQIGNFSDFLRHYIKIGNRVKLKKQVVIKFSEFNLAFTIL